MLGLLIIALATIAQCNAEPDSQFELAVEQAHQLNIERIAQLMNEADKTVPHMPPLFHPRRPLNHSQDVALRGQCEAGQTTCCPHVRIYSMEEAFGPNVVVPNKFHSLVCVGRCTGSRCNRRQSHDRSAQTISCRPVYYESQTVIWITQDDQLVKRDISDFHVTGCACGV